MTSQEIIDEGIDLQISERQAKIEIKNHGCNWDDFIKEVDWEGSAAEVLVWLGY